MDPVVHFEMPYADKNRMASFYGAAFGWEMQMFGEEMGNYVLAKTTESDESGPKRPGVINGGFYPQDAGSGTGHPSVVIAVKDIQASMAKVTESGGTVHGEPMDIPGVGQFVPFTDTEGNRGSILQPLPRG